MLYILTILEAIEKIFIYSAPFEDEYAFYNSQKQLHFNATVNLLIAIGEESKKIEDSLKISDKINWKNLAAMRDKISHDYRGIDESIVWSIVKEYLPNLKNALLDIIPNVDCHKEYISEALTSLYYEDLYYLQELTD